MWIMAMWMMAMPHRMMKMEIAPVVVSCAAWPGEAVASESTRLTLNAGSPSRAEHDCMRLSNGVAWRARSGWVVEGGVVPNEPPYNPRGPDSDGDAQALPPGSTGRHAVALVLCEVKCTAKSIAKLFVKLHRRGQTHGGDPLVAIHFVTYLSYTSHTLPHTAGPNRPLALAANCLHV